MKFTFLRQTLNSALNRCYFLVADIACSLERPVVCKKYWGKRATMLKTKIFFLGVVVFYIEIVASCGHKGQ